jgi:hypothetical protein
MAAGPRNQPAVAWQVPGRAAGAASGVTPGSRGSGRIAGDCFFEVGFVIGYGATSGFCARHPAALLAACCLVLSLGLDGCKSMDQVEYKVDHKTLTLAPDDLERHGIGFLTPAAATGREADKQALALSFSKELEQGRPEVKVVPLPTILSKVNEADLDQQYKRMYRDYLETGILEGSILQRIGEVGGVRYLAQLSLADFMQQSRGRFNFLGLRIVDTKQAAMRVFIQIWDSETGAVAWEGSAELNYAYESTTENPTPFLETAALAARRLFADLPGAQKKK